MSGQLDLHLHLGYPKTATTFLQTKVYPQLGPEVVVAASPQPSSDVALRIRDHFKYLLHGKRHRVPRGTRGIGGRVLTLARQVAEAPQALIVSDETFVGSPSPSHRLVICPSRLAERLYRIVRAWPLGEVRVLLTIRNQVDFLPSIYAEQSDQLAGASQQDFEAFVAQVLGKGFFSSGGVCLDYLLVGELLRQAVGEGLVMLPVELLDRDPGAFGAGLAAFLGPRMTLPALPKTAVNARRAGEGRWRLRAPPNGASTVADACIGMTDALREAIASRYHASNQQFAAARGLPLRRLGYC